MKEIKTYHEYQAEKGLEEGVWENEKEAKRQLVSADDVDSLSDEEIKTAEEEARRLTAEADGKKKFSEFTPEYEAHRDEHIRFLKDYLQKLRDKNYMPAAKKEGEEDYLEKKLERLESKKPNLLSYKEIKNLRQRYLELFNERNALLLSTESGKKKREKFQKIEAERLELERDLKKGGVDPFNFEIGLNKAGIKQKADDRPAEEKPVVPEAEAGGKKETKEEWSAVEGLKAPGFYKKAEILAEKDKNQIFKAENPSAALKRTKNIPTQKPDVSAEKSADSILWISEKTGLPEEEAKIFYDNVPEDFRGQRKALGFIRLMAGVEPEKGAAEILGHSPDIDFSGLKATRKINGTWNIKGLTAAGYGSKFGLLIDITGGKIGVDGPGRHNWGLKGRFSPQPTEELTQTNIARAVKKINELSGTILFGEN